LDLRGWAPGFWIKMSASAGDVRLQFQLLFWYGVITVAMLITGMLLAANLYAIAFLLGAFGWLITLPYHAGISLVLSTICFRAAFIIPFMPGRPYLWEVGALLAWTGVPLLLLLRKYPADTGYVIQSNRWLFGGLILYCLTLFATMFYRGVGLNVLGSSTGGGRLYAQQLLCAILPLLFVLVPLKERTFVRLVLLQLLLTGSFMVSELAFSVAPGVARPLLYFFEISTDAAFFELQSMSFGIRRYQSLGWFFSSFIYVLLILYRPRDFLGKRAFWLLPLIVGRYMISLLSGSRTTAALTPIMVVLLLWAQRFFDPRKMVLIGLSSLFILVFVYSQAERFPLSVQRAVCILPGIKVSSQARYDAEGTWAMRRTLRQIGLRMVPDYLWMGRGFSVSLQRVDSDRFDAALEQHLRAGRFYNGSIGLLVNTGLVGFCGVLAFFYGATRLAGGVLARVRRLGAEDVATRAALFIAVTWIVEVCFFLLVHGDSEMALRRFGLLAGLLLAAHRLVRQREPKDRENAPA
ncbi:MAG: hypothetical protein KDM81_08720, partial [Verrucomicrobiae bacterium]|nr:hypothetical protein [Verrucomicrobiae bacterium]